MGDPGPRWLLRLETDSPMFLFCLLLGLAAQIAGPTPASVADSAPVIVADDTLFVLHGGLGPFGAEVRAAALTSQLREYLNDSSARRPGIRVVEGQAHATILAGDRVLLSVLESDAPTGVPPARQARHYADILRRAVDGRTPAGPGHLAAVALAATLAGVLGVGLWRLRQRPAAN